MHVLVTGGSGFIGRSLCVALVDQGYAVTVLTRTPEKTKSLFMPLLINAIDSLDKLPADIDAVINLAGAPIIDKRWTDARKKELLKSRVDTTQKIANLINSGAINPSVFISGSAIGYYGDAQEQTLDEYSTYHHPEFSHDLCKAWEDAANMANQKTRVCILRAGIVLDENGGALHKMLLPFRLGLGGKIGSGNQWFSWIHRKDLVNMIIFLMKNEKCAGVFNGTAPHPVTNSTFAKALGKALHRPTILPVPRLVLKLAMGEMSDLLLTGQRVLPRRAIEAGFSFQYPELDIALSTILN
jgi:uncharacterized protein